MTIPSAALERAQRNEYGIQPLVIKPSDQAYSSADLAAMNAMLVEHQEFLYEQTGKTFCRIPAKRIDGELTTAEYAAGNIYHAARAQLDRQEHYDSRMMRIWIGNPKRVYVLAAVGAVQSLKNMAGRQVFNLPADPVCNPIEPWGPGVAGGPSDYALAALAGRITPEETPRSWVSDPARVIDTVKGATLHETLHCLGIQHPDETRDGPEAWLSPMAGFWFYGTPECALLPREIAEIRGEATATATRPGSHFFK